MTNKVETKTLAQLSRKGFTVISGDEDFAFYIREIGWNMRSLNRQADILETVVSEMKELLHNLDRTDTGAEALHPDRSCSCSPGAPETDLEKRRHRPKRMRHAPNEVF